MARLSKADRARVDFARACIEYGADPRELAELCSLIRAAAAAGVRACNVPNTSADGQMRRVEAQAKSMGWSTAWPGLYPSFKNAKGEEVRVMA